MTMCLHHRDLRKSDPLKLSTQPLTYQKFPRQKSLTPSFFKDYQHGSTKMQVEQTPQTGYQRRTNRTHLALPIAKPYVLSCN